jgi:hypothetical protein
MDHPQGADRARRTAPAVPTSWPGILYGDRADDRRLQRAIGCAPLRHPALWDAVMQSGHQGGP